MSIKITRLMSDKSLDMETTNILEAWETKNPKQSVRDLLNRIVLKAEARGRDFQRQLTGTVNTSLLNASKVQTFFVIKRDEEPRYLGWDHRMEDDEWFSDIDEAFLFGNQVEAATCVRKQHSVGYPTARIVKVEVKEADE